MADRPTVYLAGPVAAYDDGGAGWRESIIDFYGDAYDLKSPLDKYNVPVEELTIVDGESGDAPETVGVGEIVHGDLTLLRASDGVLVGYSDVKSIGTPMEVRWARERDYPVALWVRDDTEFDDLSPWYRYHATALTTAPGMGLRHIERQLPGESRSASEVSPDA